MAKVLASELKVGNLIYDIKWPIARTLFKVIEIIKEDHIIKMKYISGSTIYKDNEDKDGLVSFRTDAVLPWYKI